MDIIDENIGGNWNSQTMSLHRIRGFSKYVTAGRVTARVSGNRGELWSRHELDVKGGCLQESVGRELSMKVDFVYLVSTEFLITTADLIFEI